MNFQSIQRGFYKARFHAMIKSCLQSFQPQNQDFTGIASIGTEEELFLSNKQGNKANCDSFSLQSLNEISNQIPNSSPRRCKSAEVLPDSGSADPKICLQQFESLIPPKKLTKVASKQTINIMKPDEKSNLLMNNKKDFCKMSSFLPSVEGEEDSGVGRASKTRQNTFARLASKHHKLTAINLCKNQLPKIEEIDDSSPRQQKGSNRLNNQDYIEWEKDRNKKDSFGFRIEEIEGRATRQQINNGSKKFIAKKSSFEVGFDDDNESNFKFEGIGFHNDKKSTMEEVVLPKIRAGTQKEEGEDKNYDPIKKKKETSAKHKQNGLFDYDFEAYWSYKHYFLDGNCSDVLNRIEKKYFLKLRNRRSSRVSPGISPRGGNMRKKIKVFRNLKKIK